MRVIQVGVGGFGGSWLHAIPECGIEQVALVDANLEILAQAGAQRGIPSERLFTRLEDALARVNADGLVDVTPAPFHKTTTTMALKAGLHVLCEKPMSDTLESAVEMVKTARDNNRILMVTQQFRYYDQPRTIRKLITEGAIGEVDHIVAEFQIQGLLFGWRQHMRHPFIVDMAIHHFDLMRYFLGTEAERVTAQTWNPKVSNTAGDMSVFALMEFVGGARVNYTGSFRRAGSGYGLEWTLDNHGKQGEAFFGIHATIGDRCACSAKTPITPNTPSSISLRPCRKCGAMWFLSNLLAHRGITTICTIGERVSSRVSNRRPAGATICTLWL